MNNTKALHWLTCLGLFILLLTGCGGSLGGSITPPAPKAGQWHGEHLNFIVTEDGQLQNLLVEGERAFDKNCAFSFEEDMPLSEGSFEYQVGDTISLTLTFETETTASAAYSYTMCPNPASISTAVQEGSRTATWQAP
jgi:hypothetical protein